MEFIWIWISCFLSVTAVMAEAVTFEETVLDYQEKHDPLAFQNNGRPQNRGKNQTRKALLDWISLGQDVDPYLARINKACLNGDFTECSKSRAINSIANFFYQPDLNDYLRVVRMRRDIIQEIQNQSYEFASRPRSAEWDQLVKFVAKKTERFIKTIKVNTLSEILGENEVYAPRILDEIADEIDILENKKDTLFSRNRLKKLLIPMLIILKLFKLKLLLFLPLILGLASFKKFLGFMAIVIPGLIAFFKLYKPLISSHQPPVYTQSGVGFPYYKESNNHAFSPEHSSYDEPIGYHSGYQPDSGSYGQDLAYQAYKPYQK